MLEATLTRPRSVQWLGVPTTLSSTSVPPSGAPDAAVEASQPSGWSSLRSEPIRSAGFAARTSSPPSARFSVSVARQLALVRWLLCALLLVGCAEPPAEVLEYPNKCGEGGSTEEILDPFGGAYLRPMLAGGQEGDELGATLWVPGDVDGDGTPDVIVGAHGKRLYLWTSSGPARVAGPVCNQGLKVLPRRWSAPHGCGVRSGGSDFDGDGRADLVLRDMAGEDFCELVGFEADCSLPGVVAVGDVNDDGFDDGVEIRSVRPRLLSGSPEGLLGSDGLSPLAQWEVPGESRSTSPLGDVNGDGLSDFALMGGAVHVVLGDRGGLSSGPVASVSAASLPRSGPVGRVGDWNGDGYGDFRIGRRLYLGGASDFDSEPPTLDLGGPLLLEGGGGTNSGPFDFNGDGYDDIITRSIAWEEEEAPATFHWHPGRPHDAEPAESELDADGSVAGGSLGRLACVVGMGDRDGDGRDDLVFANEYSRPGGPYSGGAWVVLGREGGLVGDSLDSLVDGWLVGRHAAAHLGHISYPAYFAASGGDLNGDSRPDVAILTYTSSTNATSDTAVAVFYGTADDLRRGRVREQAGDLLWPDEDHPGFGREAEVVGDVNGDGFADLAVDDVGGRLWVFHGGPAGLGSGPASDVADSSIWDVGAITDIAGGDWNGDGYADIAVGAAWEDLGVSVLYGSPEGIGSGPLAEVVDVRLEAPGTFLGGSLASAGDANGDGYPDLLIGASGFESGYGPYCEGAVLLVAGSVNGLTAGDPFDSAVGVWTADGGACGVGELVFGPGDMDGDGLADLVSATGRWTSQQGNGEVHLLLGGAGPFAGGPISAGAYRSWVGGDPEHRLGAAIAVGDVDADGDRDLAVISRPENGADRNSLFLLLADPELPASGAIEEEATAIVQQPSHTFFHVATVGARLAEPPGKMLAIGRASSAEGDMVWLLEPTEVP